METPGDTTVTEPRFYPHHPHFVNATTDGRRTIYGFRPFTGDEPEPTDPPHPEVVSGTEEDEARYIEYRERCDETESARRCWQRTRYHRQVTPLIAAACKARPSVNEALAAMESAWKDLDTATVWPVAVKRLLDAHQKALDALGRWLDSYAAPLARAEREQPYYIREKVVDWRGIARTLGHDPDWDIGWYDTDDGGYYDPAPMADLKRTIAAQRTTLAEIASFNK